jgi:hypothetical protein
MYNENLIPKHDETIQIDKIELPENCVVDMHKQLLARLRVKGYGEILINQKNQLDSGAEGLILAIEKGEKEVKVKRLDRFSFKIQR